MLPSQRHLFSIEEGVSYLDSAAFSPLPVTTQQMANQSIERKAKPWTRDFATSRLMVEQLRAAAANQIGAQADDIAIVCSVSYGLATAARNVSLSPGQRVLMLEGEHSSQLLTWSRHAAQVGAQLDLVREPKDGDWTSAIQECMERPGALPIGVACLSPNMWYDGANINLLSLCQRLKSLGAAVVVDATQAVGVVDIDIKKLQPDFLAFPAYKWLLGPYSLAFLYAAPNRQGGDPLEQNGHSRDLADMTRNLDADKSAYLRGARRYDMGERDVFVGIPTALESLHLLSNWPRESIAARLAMLTDRLVKALEADGIPCLPKPFRSPHILGVRGMQGGASKFCLANGVYVSERNDVLRVSPHVFNTEDDIDRCAATIISYRRSCDA